MKKTLYIFSVILLSSLLFTSCLSSDGDIDTEKPVINLLDPADHEAIEAGTSIHFEMEVSDNIALGSYDIDIHSAEGHTHSKGVLSTADDGHDHDEENESRKSFKYKNSWSDIRGLRNTHIHHHEIEIPIDAKRGEYHFILKVLDNAGNQAMEVREFFIVNEGEGGADHDHDHNH